MELERTGSEGTAIVLIHGIPGSGGVWAGVAEQLGRDHVVLSPDLLGFGSSERARDADELWADCQARALADALDAAGVEVPVLVGWGDRDPFFPLDQAERTAAAAPGARLAIYPGAGHFLPSERPDELAADIRLLASA